MGVEPVGQVWAVLPRGHGVLVEEVGDVVLTHRVTLAAPGGVEHQGPGVRWAGVEHGGVLVEVTAGLVHDRDGPRLVALAGDGHGAAPGCGVDVGVPQVEEFLDAGGGIEQDQDDRGVAQATGGVLAGGADQGVHGGDRQRVGGGGGRPDPSDVLDVEPDGDEGGVFCGAVGQEGLDRGEALIRRGGGQVLRVGQPGGEPGDGDPVDGLEGDLGEVEVPGLAQVDQQGPQRGLVGTDGVGAEPAGAGQVNGQPGPDETVEVT